MCGIAGGLTSGVTCAAAGRDRGDDGDDDLRGPDAGAVWCSAHAAIGHRRLSVIDLPGGEQPMRAPGEDDVVLTFSGEIYNFTELRRELAARGHQFRTGRTPKCCSTATWNGARTACAG